VSRHDPDHRNDPDHRHGVRALIHGLFSGHSHDPTDSIDNALESSTQGIRAVKISLIGLGATAILQLVIVAVSGSVALLADTVHNFSDALTAIPLWIAFALSRRPATRRYTYGFGRAEDLAGLFIVAMIAFSAVFAGVESVRRLVDPVAITHVWWVAAAGLVGFAGNELVAVFRIRVGRRIGSAALVADGLHARTDGLTSLAVLVGALGVAAGIPLADPVVGLLITVMILALLRGAARDVFARLMDGVDPELVLRAERALTESEGVRSVPLVRMRWIGHELNADVTVAVDPALSVAAAKDIATRVSERLRSAVPRITAVVVTTCPAHDRSNHLGRSHRSADPC
jgi:cation diffusion facilitator family transporter